VLGGQLQPLEAYARTDLASPPNSLLSATHYPRTHTSAVHIVHRLQHWRATAPFSFSLLFFTRDVLVFPSPIRSHQHLPTHPHNISLATPTTFESTYPSPNISLPTSKPPPHNISLPTPRHLSNNPPTSPYPLPPTSPYPPPQHLPSHPSQPLPTHPHNLSLPTP
jgi:hypothetical protein